MKPSSVAAALPVLALAFLAFVTYRRRREWRDSLMLAAPAWGGLVVLISELLSWRHAVSPRWLAVSWTLVDVALFMLWRRAPIAPEPPPRQPLSAVDRLMVAAITVIAALVGATALLSPPNTYDAMVYHLPRVIQWLQHNDLEFYPTSAPPQLHFFPGAELIVLQLHGLSGGDHLDNLPQFAAMLGSLVGVSTIARELGAERRGQILAALVCATLPQGVLYASSAKNDYVAAFWLICALSHGFGIRRDTGWARTVSLGLSLGLAALTKVTIGAFALPLLLAIALSWDARAARTVLRRTPAICILALAVIAGPALRNFRYYGNPMGTTVEFGTFKYGSDDHSPSAIASGVLRNLGLHLATPVPAVNEWEERLIRKTIRLLGADPDDPRTTWFGTTFRIHWLPRLETAAGNPLQALAFIATLLLFFSARAQRRGALAQYGIAVVAGFVIFSTVFRWQPWHVRLHLPLFVAASAFTGTVLAKSLSERGVACVGALFLAASIPPALTNDSRPLVGRQSILLQSRESIYFAERKDLRDGVAAAAHWVASLRCREVGINDAHDFWSYPPMAIIANQAAPPIMDYIGVLNESARLDRGRLGATPCAVLCLNCASVPEIIQRYENTIGPATIFGNAVVFSKKLPP